MAGISTLLHSGEQDPSDLIVDRMSSLPPEILDHILGKLPMIEVARMSVLAKFWRNIWLSLSRLTVKNSDLAKVLNNGNIEWSTVSTIINTFLSHHTCGIRTFYLSAWCKPHYSDVYPWLQYLVEQNIEALSLEELGPQQLLEMPLHLFGFTKLRSLLLSSCALQMPSTFGGFNTLGELSFDNVLISDDDLQRLILACPLLVKLTLLRMHALKHLRICAPNLAALEIDTELEDIIIERGACLVSFYIRFALLFGRTPTVNWRSVISCLSSLAALESLVLYGDFIKILAAEYDALDTFPLRNDTLTCLSLCDVKFDTIEVFRVCLSLLSSWPNIKSFKLSAFSGKCQKLVTTFLKEIHGLFSFPELISLFVSFPTNNGMECTLNFIEFLCIHSPNLKVLRIAKNGSHKPNDARVSKMLLRFRKICPPQASVQYKYIRD